MSGLGLPHHHLHEVDVELTVTIGRPRDAVFDVLEDAEQMARWMAEFETVERVAGDAPIGAGTTFRYEVARYGLESTFEWREHEPPRRLRWDGPELETPLGLLVPAGSFTLARANGGATLVTAGFAPRVGGSLALMQGVIRPAIEHAAHADLERLRELLEADGGSG